VEYKSSYSVMVTTKDAATLAGLSEGGLRAMLHRYPELRPTTKHGDLVYLWSPDDIERIIRHRKANPPKPKRVYTRKETT
jgi:hypothetical protein